MTITELIDKLIDFRLLHGDLPTVTFFRGHQVVVSTVLPVVDDDLKVVKVLIS